MFRGLIGLFDIFFEPNISGCFMTFSLKLFWKNSDKELLWGQRFELCIWPSTCVRMSPD